MIVTAFTAAVVYVVTGIDYLIIVALSILIFLDLLQYYF